MVTPNLKRELHRRRRQLKLPLGANLFLSMLEGIEGGFAISTGVIAGLSFASITDKRILLITAAISILVNGFNASAVKYSSEHYEDELDGREKHDPWRAYFLPAALEFIIYFAICLLTLLPLVFFENIYMALLWCTAITTVILFAAGAWRGFLLHTKPARDGFEVAFLGLLIIFIGASAGYMLNHG